MFERGSLGHQPQTRRRHAVGVDPALRGADEHEVVDALGFGRRECLCDEPAEAHPDDMGAIDARCVEHRECIVRQDTDAVGTAWLVAVADTAIVEADDAEVLGEPSGHRPPPGAAVAEPVDQEQRWALPVDLEREPYRAVRRVLHGGDPSRQASSRGRRFPAPGRRRGAPAARCGRPNARSPSQASRPTSCRRPSMRRRASRPRPSGRRR